MSLRKWKRFPVQLSDTDYLDVKLELENGVLISFSLNYRAEIKGKFHPVYRVDMAHGFLHEQRYWISPEPRPLVTLGQSLNATYLSYRDRIRKHYLRYKEYYLKRMVGGD